VNSPALARLARFVRRALLGACVTFALSTPAAIVRAEDGGGEIAYRVKIGFLVNFLRFSDWPEAALPPGSSFRLAVAGDDATFALISGALAGKVVNGRTVAVERADQQSQGAPPHLLFITRSAPAGAQTLAQRYTSAPVLTLGERDGFARGGGILNFVLVDEAVRFEVNLTAAQRAGIRISSRVSKMAILVRPES
jgi:hypothetical protein